MMNGLPPEKTWLEKMLTGSAAATILVALVGQAVFSIVFQIRNNEQQTALIEANKVSIATLRNEIVNLQTPLSTLVLRMDGRLSALEADSKNTAVRLDHSDALQSARVDNIDKNGTRALDVVSANQQRMVTAIDRLEARLSSVDTRVTDVQGKGVLVLQNQVDLIRSDIKRIDEQQQRILSTLDQQYTTLNEFIKKTLPAQRK